MGFKIIGETPFDFAGRSVSSAGDFNNDGFDDFIVGAYRYNDVGAAYVIFGQNDEQEIDNIDLSTLSENELGFKIIGENPFDNAGISVSSAGDFNNDGFDDLIVGAYGYDEGGDSAGAAYVIFGQGDEQEIDDIDLSTLSEDELGFKIIGENPFDNAGISVSSAGDFNNDGFNDLIVGAHGYDDGTN